MPDLTDDQLETELRALGRQLVVDPLPADLSDRIMARIAPAVVVDPVPSAAGWREWMRRRRRRVGLSVAVAVVFAAAVIPPVRAAVIELLRIGGIAVEQAPSPTSTLPPTGIGSATAPIGTSGTAAGTGTPVSLGEARQMVGFEIGVPATLGPPSDVRVTHDARVVEMTWGSGPTTVHLDQFDGTLSYGYLKQVWADVTPVEVAGRDGVWLAEPHLIAWVDRSGTEHTEQPRLAGPTLAWVHQTAGSEVTYRLEGSLTKDQALTIANSVR